MKGLTSCSPGAIRATNEGEHEVRPYVWGRFPVGANLVFTRIVRAIDEGEHKVRPYKNQAESTPRTS